MKILMSRCPYLDYESHNFFGNSDDEYICTLTGAKMSVDSSQVKNACKAEYGDAYKKCSAYQNS